LHKILQIGDLRNIQNSHPKKQQLKEPIAKLRHWQFRIFETTSIPFLPNSPKKAQRGHSPHLLHHFITTLTVPACKEIRHLAIHDPHHAKEMKKITPKSISNLTMKKKMIDGLTALLTHTTPICHNHSSLVKIIQSENPSEGSRPHKRTGWTGSSSKRQSITGYCTLGNLVTWKSKEERVMAQSSAKAEYRAMVTNRSSFNTLFIFMQAIQIGVRETKIYTKFEK
jgi:hypothetical protein